MSHRLPSALAGLLALAVAAPAYADCGSDGTSEEVGRAFAQAQAHERSGRREDAVLAYVRAQAYLCDGPNTVEAEAARRAAALSAPLGAEAASRGDLEEALRWYEAGGHYIAADRMMIGLLRAQPDAPAMFDRANAHFARRARPAFAANDRVRIAAAGAYVLDRAAIDEVARTPARALERALEREDAAFAAFSEANAREYERLVKSRPARASDLAAFPAAAAAQQEFAARWPEDPLAKSRQELHLARAWARRLPLDAQPQAQRRIAERAARRAQLLAQRYAGAPQLLEAAAEYYRDQQLESQAAAVRARAAQLGEQALRRQAFQLASEYFDAAGDRERSRRAGERAHERASRQMAGPIEAAQRQAEQPRSALGDPARVEAPRSGTEDLERKLGR